MTMEPSEMTRDEFLEAFGAVFPHSPWVAEGVWNGGLEFRHDTAAGMHEAMCNEIRQADHEQKLALLQAHPVLPFAVGADDPAEHAGRDNHDPRLDQCSEAEFADFQRLTRDYREKFGFPFILAVQGFQRRQVMDILRRRLDHSPEEEFQNALQQAMRIALFRLEALLK